MAWNDPIVDEVRRERERLLQEAGGFESYVRKLRLKEQDHTDRLNHTDLKPNEDQSEPGQESKVN